MLGPLSRPGPHLANSGCTIVTGALPERLRPEIGRIGRVGSEGPIGRGCSRRFCQFALGLRNGAGQLSLSDLALASEQASGRMMPDGKRGKGRGWLHARYGESRRMCPLGAFGVQLPGELDGDRL